LNIISKKIRNRGAIGNGDAYDFFKTIKCGFRACGVCVILVILKYDKTTTDYFIKKKIVDHIF